MAGNLETDEIRFKPTKNRIILDFSDCKYLGEVHRLLKAKFGFPEYYGENWDALWDCLDGRFDGMGTVLIELYGFSSMNEELKGYCVTMLKIFDELHEKSPNVCFVLMD